MDGRSVYHLRAIHHLSSMSYMTRLLQLARHSLESTRAGPALAAVGMAVLAAAACGAPGGPDNVVFVLPDDAVAVPTHVF